MDLNLK